MRFLLSLSLLLSPAALAPNARPAARCTLAIKPLEKFDGAEYVFTGRVAEIVGPLRSERAGQVWGLLVEVGEKVHAPSDLGARAEVFPFHLGDDCSDVPWDKENLTRFFPVGMKVRVIAVKSLVFKEPAADGAVRLDADLYDNGQVARNELGGAQMTSATTVFDYAAFKWPEEEETDENEPLLEARWSLPRFELRKDLLRLREADAEAARLQILERLVAYPSRYDFKFDVVARLYVKDEQALAELLKKREEAVARFRPAS
ncbi:MAG TPA: hypothetical protein VK421_15370 [Pyrinomonadaceae bacterium]|nr:hypothetical protein [Pyrinomonadaceae bacterium]